MRSFSETALALNGWLTISFKKVMAVPDPSTVALGASSSSFSMLPVWSGSVWSTTM